MLASGRWTGHILKFHPELDGPDSLREAVRDPDYIVREERQASASSIYYRMGGCATYPKLRLAVVALWGAPNDNGWVTTAYATESPKSQGEIEWVRKAPR